MTETGPDANQPDANRPPVVAVVPAYDPDPDVLALVDTLASQVSKVVVVDDGSPTRSDLLETVAEHGGQVVRHEANRGIAAALNTGVRVALATGAPVAVLTVDQDSRVPDGYVSALLNTWDKAERDGRRVGLVAPQHVTGLPDQKAGRAVIQSGLLIPAATLRQVGEFDERLFIDGVDADYALRCLDAGLAVIVAAGLTVAHRLGETREIRLAGRTVRLTRSAPNRYYYLTRNRISLVRRHAPRHPGWAAGQLVGLAGHLGLVIALDPERRTRAREAWRGLGDGLRGRSGSREDIRT
jgi:rhamnosyltransferase